MCAAGGWTSPKGNRRRHGRTGACASARSAWFDGPPRTRKRPRSVSDARDPTTSPRPARTRADLPCLLPGFDGRPWNPSARRRTTSIPLSAARPRGRRSRSCRVVVRAACGGTRSSSDERDELQESDRSVRPDLDLLFELADLPVVDQDDEAVGVEGLYGQLELFFGVYPPPLAHPKAVEGSLRVRRLNEPAEVLGLSQVVVAHLVCDAGADQLPHRDPAFHNIEREISVLISPEANRRFVPDLQRRRHRHTPSSKPSGNVYEAYGPWGAMTSTKSAGKVVIQSSTWSSRSHRDS